jgi:nucleotide-binding universal stress UspA family protein
MGHRTKSGVEEFVFGSAASGILRKTHSPLLIIPETAKFKKPENILFSNDHKFNDVADLDPMVKKMFKNYNSTVHVVSVVPEKTTAGTGSRAAVADEKIEKYFGDTLHVYHTVENDDVVDGLNTFVEQNKIDIVTMIPHKHNLFEKLFIGGATKKMAFHTHVPLLSLSPRLHQIPSKEHLSG